MMNEQAVWREVLRENRGTILVMMTIAVVLGVVLGVLIGVNNATVGNEAEVATELVEKEEAAESTLDVADYVDEIHAVIRGMYGEKLNGYEIARGKLLLDGDWYVTTIKIPSEDQWSLPEDAYRVVMHKVDGQWQMVAGPGLLLVYAEYPDVPVGVLVSANNL